MNGKRLYKSLTDKKICGVCGGLGELLNVDPNLVRLAAVFTAFWGGLGIVVYFVAAIIFPEGKPDDNQNNNNAQQKQNTQQARPTPPPVQTTTTTPPDQVIYANTNVDIKDIKPVKDTEDKKED